MSNAEKFVGRQSAGFDNPAADFGLVLDSLPQAVLVTAKDNTIQYANMAAENVFSASAKYMMQHNLDRFVPFGSPVLNLVEQVLATGAPVVDYKINVSTPRTGA